MIIGNCRVIFWDVVPRQRANKESLLIKNTPVFLHYEKKNAVNLVTLIKYLSEYYFS